MDNGIWREKKTWILTSAVAGHYRIPDLRIVIYLMPYRNPVSDHGRFTKYRSNANHREYYLNFSATARVASSDEKKTRFLASQSVKYFFFFNHTVTPRSRYYIAINVVYFDKSRLWIFNRFFIGRWLIVMVFHSCAVLLLHVRFYIMIHVLRCWNGHIVRRDTFIILLGFASDILTEGVKGRARRRPI